MPDIYILDIDGTIDKDVLKGKILQKLLYRFKKAYDAGAYFYIVTARRLNEFNYNEHKLLSHNVPQEMVDFIYYVTRKSTGRWLYYNKNLSEPIDKVTPILYFNNVLQYERNYVKNNEEHMNFTMGLHKMLQIEEIIAKHSKLIGDNASHVFFFDDAKYNYDAWEFFYTYLNPKFRYMNFIGGRNKAVFTLPDLF